MGIFDFYNKAKNWSLLGSTCTDPILNVTDALLAKSSEKLLEKILFGYTTYIWQNDLTGAIKKEEYIGVDETPLRALLNRVDQWGKYEINLDGKKYAIVKLQENNVLPLVEATPVPQLIDNSKPIDIKNLPVR